jgi:hypothetical protein
MTYLKNHKSLLQSCLAFLEQCAHFTLMEKALDFVAILLGFNKCMNFMEGPNCRQTESLVAGQATYSVNFPI